MYIIKMKRIFVKVNNVKWNTTFKKGLYRGKKMLEKTYFLQEILFYTLGFEREQNFSVGKAKEYETFFKIKRNAFKI